MVFALGPWVAGYYACQQHCKSTAFAAASTSASSGGAYVVDFSEGQVQDPGEDAGKICTWSGTKRTETLPTAERGMTEKRVGPKR